MLALLIATMGGSGSTAVQDILRPHFLILDKPDTVFRNILPELKVTNRSQEPWETRAAGISHFNPDDPLSTAINLLEACKRHSESVVLISNTFAELGIWSRARTSGVTFLLRHPLHAYLSWCKSERHGDIAEQFGGKENAAFARRFAIRWSKIATEYFRLREIGCGPSLLRFEFLPSDSIEVIRTVPLFQAVATSWRSELRNFGSAFDNLSDLFREVTGQNFFRLYERWDV